MIELVERPQPDYYYKAPQCYYHRNASGVTVPCRIVIYP